MANEFPAQDINVEKLIRITCQSNNTTINFLVADDTI